MWTDADDRLAHRLAFACDHGELDLIPPCRVIETLPTALFIARRAVRPAGPPKAPPVPQEPPPPRRSGERLLRIFAGTVLALGAVWLVLVATF